MSHAGAGAALHSTRLSHERVFSYPLKQVWPTAIRYLRVDRGYAIVDRDEEVGYLLFEFPLGSGRDPTPVGQGSVEMFAIKDAAGRDAVQVKVSTDQGPPHLPHAVAEGIAAKLRAERGQPPPPKPAPKPPKDEKPAPEPPKDEEPPLFLDPNGPSDP